MKRFLSLLLAIMLLLSSAGTLAITSVALTNTGIEFSSAEGEPGDTVTLTLSIKSNPGIAGLAASLKYDTTALSITDVKKGSLFSGFTAGKNYVWDESENVTDDGVLATFTFKISEQAEAKDYDVSAIVRSCVNDDIEDVECNAIDGKITVKQNQIPVTGLALDKTSAIVKTGDETLTLTPVFTPDTATNKKLTWESTDNSVATVADGVVTLIKKGVVTITATSVDGNYSASCVVTINCSHRMGTDYPADASTCIHHGHAAYTVCDECGEIISGSDAELPFADHTGGTADCLHKAVCSVCGKEYGEFGNHTLTKHERVEPDHNNIGNIEYYTCDVCDKVFSDYLGENEISLSDTALAVIPHSYPTNWLTDDSGHWKECECGNKIDFAAHSYDNACDTTCNICGYIRSITHNYSNGWSDNGNSTHSRTCTVCGNIETVEHTYDENGICTACGGNEVDQHYLKGDINNDGSINGKDANLLQQLCSGRFFGTKLQREAADVFCDGLLNGKDGNRVLMYIKGNISSFD